MTSSLTSSIQCVPARRNRQRLYVCVQCKPLVLPCPMYNTQQPEHAHSTHKQRLCSARARGLGVQLETNMPPLGWYVSRQCPASPALWGECEMYSVMMPTTALSHSSSRGWKHHMRVSQRQPRATACRRACAEAGHRLYFGKSPQAEKNASTWATKASRRPRLTTTCSSSAPQGNRVPAQISTQWVSVRSRSPCSAQASA